MGILRTLSDFLGGAYAVQWFFAAVAICGFGFALIFLPETHGKKLSEIQAHFSDEAKETETAKGKRGDESQAEASIGNGARI